MLFIIMSIVKFSDFLHSELLEVSKQVQFLWGWYAKIGSAVGSVWQHLQNMYHSLFKLNDALTKTLSLDIESNRNLV